MIYLIEEIIVSLQCERGDSNTFRDRGLGRNHMANHSETMKSCRVQFVDMELDTNDKIVIAKPVECKIYDPRRITRQDFKMRNIAENKTFSAIFF